MIHFTRGDIFTQPVEALVNPVNCVGVMGRGLALQFRRRFPNVFLAYRDACARADVQPGRILSSADGRPPAPLDRPFPHQTPLARPQPARRYRRRPSRPGHHRHPQPHPVPRGTAARLRPRRPRLAHRPPAYRRPSQPARLPDDHARALTTPHNRFGAPPGELPSCFSPSRSTAPRHIAAERDEEREARKG